MLHVYAGINTQRSSVRRASCFPSPLSPPSLSPPPPLPHAISPPLSPLPLQISDEGIARLARACPELRKFSCGGGNFGVTGLNALLSGCTQMEDLTLKRR